MSSSRSFPRNTGRFNHIFWFVVFVILTGGLSYLLSRAKAANSPVLSFNKNTHENFVAEMQCEPQLDIAHPVCDISAAPVSLEVDLAKRIQVEFWLAAKLGVEETQNIKQAVYNILMENAQHPATRAKLIRVLAHQDFHFVIEDLPDNYGAGGKYEGQNNRITILHSALKVGLSLHGTLNHELHHADSHLARGAVGSDAPYITNEEYEAFKQAVEACDISTTTRLNELMGLNQRKVATKEERRAFVSVKKLLSDYKPTLIPVVVRKSESEIAEMETDLENGKPVVIGKLHIKKFDRNNGQVYAWGYHASDLTDPQQLVHAYIYDNLRHLNTVKAMYAKHASESGANLDELVFVERDAEIHGSPKHAEFFCSPLTMYHAAFRKAHAVEDETLEKTQKPSFK